MEYNETIERDKLFIL